MPFDGGHDCVIGKAGARAFADGGRFGVVAAKRDLVVFHPRAVQPENADMADMVMAAGVDAARDLDLELADFMFQPEACEMRGDLLRDRDRAGGGQRAVIHAGAGDDIGDQADIGGGKPGLLQRARRPPAGRT